MNSDSTQRWDEGSIANSGSASKFDSVQGTERLSFFDWRVPLFGFDLHTGISQPNYRISEVSGTSQSRAGDRNRDAEYDAEFENRRTRLIAAVRRLKESAPNWSGASTKVNAASALTAEQFLICLPSTVALPKVAPDGEGDVMFVWDDPGKQCIVIAEPKLLHLVTKPGDPAGVQVTAQRFLGIQIPPPILRNLPTK